MVDLGEGLIVKGHIIFSQGDEDTFFLDRDGGFTAVHTCQTLQAIHLCFLLYVNSFSTKPQINAQYFP